MAARPRTFDEIIAALNPAERARIERIETFSDPNAPNGEGEISLAEDRDQPGEWRVEYFHEADGYVTFLRGRWHSSARGPTSTRSNPGP
jgi:hypothetical protein